MAGKSDFTDEEWEDLRKGATGAGLLVSVSDRSFFDTFKEASSLAKHVKGSRDSDSQLVRELASEGGTGFGMIASPSEVQDGTFESLEGRGRDVALEGPRRAGELPRVRARARRVGRQGRGRWGRGRGRHDREDQGRARVAHSGSGSVPTPSAIRLM